jgi:hypothetical protein
VIGATTRSRAGKRVRNKRQAGPVDTPLAAGRDTTPGEARAGDIAPVIFRSEARGASTRPALEVPARPGWTDQEDDMRMFRVPLFYLILAASTLMLGPVPASAQIGASITVAPPGLPIYSQPLIPSVGYIWTPGFWAYGPYGYYWVPGTWVLPPAVGLLWTPGYWGWVNDAYVWNTGYWGPQVGFYGGVNYGFGYTGSGYDGGYWNNGALYYNRAANNIGGTNITNVYTKNINVNQSVTNIAYNGGPGGVRAQPTPAEVAASHEHRIPPTSVQVQHQQAASTNHAQLASVNQGRPPIAATARPGEFTGSGVVAAHGAPARAAEQQPPTGQRAVPPNAAGQHAVAGRPGQAPAAQARPAEQHAVPGRPGQAPTAQARSAEQHAVPGRPAQTPAAQVRPVEQHALPERPGQTPSAQARPAPPHVAPPPAAQAHAVQARPATPPAAQVQQERAAQQHAVQQQRPAPQHAPQPRQAAQHPPAPHPAAKGQAHCPEGGCR